MLISWPPTFFQISELKPVSADKILWISVFTETIETVGSLEEIVLHLRNVTLPYLDRPQRCESFMVPFFTTSARVQVTGSRSELPLCVLDSEGFSDIDFIFILEGILAVSEDDPASIEGKDVILLVAMTIQSY